MTIRELISRELARSEEADPRVIARRTLAKLSREQSQEALVVGLEKITHAEILAARQDRHYHGEDQSARSTGPSRWRIAMPERVFVGEWKLLTDCNLDDLQWLADDYRLRAHQMETKEQEYRRLAEDLERSGCVTVGEMWQRDERRVA